MTGDRQVEPYALRTTPTVRRALAERVPVGVVVAAYEFMVGPLVREPYRVGRRLLPPLDDRFSARRGTTGSSTGSMTATTPSRLST